MTKLTRRIWLFSLIALICSPVYASMVVKVAANNKAIAISQDSRKPYNLRDYVCVFKGGSQLVCGTVLKVTRTLALVKLDTANSEIGRGDLVRISSPHRRPAATLMDTEPTSSPGDGQRHHDISGGVSAGTNYFFPMVEFEWAFSPHLALGVRPLYFSSSTQGASVSALAGMVSLDWYSKGYFSGIWGEVAAGAYSFSASDAGIQESKVSPAFTATIGYKYRHHSGFNAGLGAGMQFISDPQLTTVVVNAANLQALVLFTLGYAF